MPGPHALMLLVGALLAADEPGRLLTQAEQSFHRGLDAKQDPDKARPYFQQAAHGFAQLHEQGACNSALYLNWGNAEVLAGNVPQAILAYQRGLRRAPGNGELRENLALARDQVDYPAQLRRAILGHNPWLPHASRGFMFGSVAVLYTLACLFVSRWLMTRRSGLLGYASACLVSAAVAGFSWHQKETQLQQDREQPLVVIARETGLFRGNGTSYPRHAELTTLSPGLEARRIVERGDWLQVRFANGVVGWVPAETVLVDEP